MFIKTLFVVAEKQPRWPSTEKWKKKMCYIYIMENYLVVEDNGIIKFAGKLMELQKIILIEVTHTQKGEHCMCSLISGH